MQVIRINQSGNIPTFHSNLQAGLFNEPRPKDTVHIRFGDQTIPAVNTARIAELERQIHEVNHRFNVSISARDGLLQFLQCLSDAMAGKKHLLLEVMIPAKDREQLADPKTREEALNRQIDRIERVLNLSELPAPVTEALNQPVDFEHSVHHLPLQNGETVDNLLTAEQQQRWSRLLRALQTLQRLKDWAESLSSALEREQRLWERATRGETPTGGQRPFVEQAQVEQTCNTEPYQRFSEAYPKYQALMTNWESDES